MERELDLVNFGATAFTGRLASHYFSKVPNLRWAVAGRSEAKVSSLMKELRAFPNPPVATYMVDHKDFEGVRRITERAKAAVNFAGPFNRHGESVIAGCASSGTHYLDITGETLWIRQMMDRYDSTAQETGAVLLPFAGFDSIPSDLGVWLAMRAARGRKVSRVIGLFKVKGGINGGSFQTALDMLEFTRAESRRFLDPYLLVPSESATQWKRPKDATRPISFNVPGEGRKIAPPFFMAPINSRTVYRSMAIRKSDPFEYVELMEVPELLAPISAWGWAATLRAFQRFGKVPAIRNVYKKVGPKEGNGPSKQAQDSGFVRARFFAYDGEELVGRSKIQFAGDPGNKMTTVLVCEATLCLLRAELKGKAGFFTPSTLLGDALAERLKNAGVEIRAQ